MKPLNVPLMMEVGVFDTDLTHFGEWDGVNTTAWVKFNEGEGNPTETKSGNAATIQTGDWVDVGDHKGLQVDGITEYIKFVADSSYLSGITTKFTIDMILRMDTWVAAMALAGISDNVNASSSDDSFLWRAQAISGRVRSYTRTDAANLINSTYTHSNGELNHYRIAMDSTSDLQRTRYFIDDMSNNVGEMTPTLNSSLQNDATNGLTFGALDDGTFPSAVTIVEFMVRIGYHTDQLPPL